MESSDIQPHPGNLELGEDLEILIRALETPPIATTLISQLPPIHTGRASFRLQLSDGRLLKGVRCALAQDAARIEALLRLMPTQYFPRSVARRGAALLLDWMPGIALSKDDCTTALLRASGRLQAAIHQLDVPERAAMPLVRRSSAWDTWHDEHLRQLVAAKALTAEDGVALLRLAQRNAPARTRLAICHWDFCAENIVKDADDRIYVVDNETLAVDACEYDLARTWYRWPMTASQRAAYVEGYGESPEITNFDAHLLHFGVVVLAEAAAYRMRVHAPSAQVPLQRLHALLSHPAGIAARS